MNKHQNTQLRRGLVVLASGVFIFGATFLLNKSVDIEQQPPIRISATDSTERFSFSYPDGWKIEPYEWGGSGEGDVEAPAEPDWTKVSKPISLILKDNPEVMISLTTSAYGDYWTTFADLKSKVKEDYFATTLYEGLIDDSHEVLFVRVDYLGPPDAKVESFTDHRYYYDLGSEVLTVEFREKYHHDWYPEQELDQSKYLLDFQTIVDSIRL